MPGLQVNRQPNLVLVGHPPARMLAPDCIASRAYSRCAHWNLTSPPPAFSTSSRRFCNCSFDHRIGLPSSALSVGYTQKGRNPRMPINFGYSGVNFVKGYKKCSVFFGTTQKLS